MFVLRADGWYRYDPKTREEEKITKISTPLSPERVFYRLQHEIEALEQEEKEKKKKLKIKDSSGEA